MKPLWLRDDLIKLLYEDNDIVAIDKPYGFDSHTNESKAGKDQADFVTPGLIELFEKQLGRELHIVHRLDRTTTGVLVFAKTPEAAKIYRDFFRERRVKKAYTFISRVQSKTASIKTLNCAAPIIRNGSSLDAKTDFQFVSRAGLIERWDAFPKTGRNHQIRIHAVAVGLPLYGDVKYGGAKGPFICLHNRQMEFPNGLVLESNPPRYFDDLEILNDPELARWLLEIDRRDRLFVSGASVRLFHGRRTEERDERGFALDRRGPKLILSRPRDSLSQTEEAFVEKLSRVLDQKIDIRLRKLSPAEKSEKWIVQEGPARFELREGIAATVGLEANQRLQRNLVLRSSEGRSVLNLFAYAGGISVMALKGGARDLISINTSKALTEWARENVALNGLDESKAKFLLRDALTFLEKAKAKSESFDLIICDPPSFWRAEKKIFKIEADLEFILRSCLAVMNDDGEILFSTSSDSLFADDIRKAVLKAETSLKKNRRLEIYYLQPSLDFEIPGETPAFKSFLITSCNRADASYANSTRGR